MQAPTTCGRDQTIAARTECYCQRERGMIHGMRLGIIVGHGHPIFQTILAQLCGIKNAIASGMEMALMVFVTGQLDLNLDYP